MAVHARTPFVEVPVALLHIYGYQAVFSAPSRHAVQYAPGHGHHVACEGPVAAEEQVLVQRQYEVEREAGDGYGAARRRAQLQQAVLALAQRQQAQALAGHVVFAERVVSAEHLIARIHAVQRLLAPRAVLVVLMQAGAQRVAADVVYAAVQRVGGMEAGTQVERILDRARARIAQREPMRAHEQRYVPQPRAAYLVQQAVSARAGHAARGEVARVHICAHALVVQVLAPAYQHLALAGRVQLYVDKAHRLAAQVERDVYALALLRAIAHLAGQHGLAPHAGHIGALAEGHGRVLHQHAYGIAYGALRVYALGHHARLDALAQREPLYGARMQPGRVVQLPRRAPALSSPAQVALEGIAHLPGDAVHIAAAVDGVGRDRGGGAAGGQHPVALADLEYERGAARAVDGAVLYLAVRKYLYLVFTFGHEGRDVHLVIYLVLGVVGILAKGGHAAVNISDVLRIGADAQRACAAPRSEQLPGQHVLIGTGALLGPYPLCR